jgi:hypothetical protein
MREGKYAKYVKYVIQHFLPLHTFLPFTIHKPEQRKKRVKSKKWKITYFTYFTYRDQEAKAVFHVRRNEGNA